jgi:hypothetical protein
MKKNENVMKIISKMKKMKIEENMNMKIMATENEILL